MELELFYCTALRFRIHVILFVVMNMLYLLGCCPNGIISRISDLMMKLVTMGLLILCSSEHAFVMVTLQSDGIMRCKL
jgi:hypothetical protein